MADKLVWIDCEMTGLDIDKDALIEVAALVTDKNLEVLDEGVDVLIRPSEEDLTQMGDFVRRMHEKSGLLAELTSVKTTMAEAQDIVLSYVKKHLPEPRRAPLAGSTIGTDRLFLARDMPELENWLHYRNVDVSTIKELARRWYPRVFFKAPIKNGNHRAMADIQESIEELRYYRDAIFVEQPGPATQQAHAIALRHQGTLTGLRPDDSAEGSLDESSGDADATD